MAYLLRNKAAYEKLVAKIREGFTREEELKYDKLINLPYFSACVEEALRIFPPVPLGLMRLIPEGGDTIEGHFLPAGVSLSSSFLC